MVTSSAGNAPVTAVPAAAAGGKPVVRVAPLNVNNQLAAAAKNGTGTGVVPASQGRFPDKTLHAEILLQRTPVEQTAVIPHYNEVDGTAKSKERVKKN